MIEYDKEIFIHDNLNNGYKYFLDKKHPLAMSSGLVYFHRHVASIHLGRWILKEEVVHHKDGNKTNNDPLNLEVLTPSAHSLLHHTEYGHSALKMFECLNCKSLFVPDKNNSKYCSVSCMWVGTKKFDISKEELEKMVWEMPTEKIGKIFNVSGKAVEKRCKKLEIPKPPRGYWRKVETGIIPKKVLTD